MTVSIKNDIEWTNSESNYMIDKKEQRNNGAMNQNERESEGFLYFASSRAFTHTTKSSLLPNIRSISSLTMATPTPYTGKSITDVLATELLVIVCESLSREDLTNFRLANKVCAEVASKNLVQDLHVMFTEKSFSNLLSISKQPNLSKHVRSILYEPRTLREFCKNEYINCIIEELRPMPPFGEEDLDKGYELYNHIRRREVYLNALNYDIVVFAQAVPKFPNFNKIIVDDAGLPSDQFIYSYNCKAYLCKGMFSLGSSQSYTAYNYGRLHALFLAASLAGVKLTTFRATALPLAFFSATPMISTDVALSALQHVQHIDITIKVSLEEWQVRINGIVPRLAQFLSLASNLESLRIDLGEPQERSMIPIALDAVIGSTGNFPKLRSLDLRHFSCTNAFFSEFLQKHAGTLENLSLDTMTMASNCAGWGNVFNTLETGLKLKSCYFTGVWHEGWDSEEENGTYPIKLSASYTGTRSSSLGEVLQHRVIKKFMPAGDEWITMDEIWATATRESEERGYETYSDDSAEDIDSDDYGIYDYEDLSEVDDFGHYIHDEDQDEDEDDDDDNDEDDDEGRDDEDDQDSID
ncbi:uncharacterized protein Bfra_003681 [Botrytis fragariae]|uniref:F-box domain-containing protein n=1 Tax=Botrytis fragariae TaxID=1964551 RepID=A0A8H6AWS4_9HELO|nr:uncharacterized protein Bfra_003681 [Botrytis fragariae]KAF5875228.1 hypothetical protein Bfra_003681 [Botrytis fragariae]